VAKVAVATTSQLAADGANEVAQQGGNAVDCALAAALFTMNTEPGVCALAGSAYVTVWEPGSDPITIDGNVAVPGSGLADAGSSHTVSDVMLDYGGGIATLAGPGSVAVPGSLAAIERAWELYGNASWQDLFAPVIAATRDGFPLSSACNYYLGYSGENIFGRSDDGFFALHNADRVLHEAGSMIVVPHLSDTLSAIAAEGASLFYEGELAKTISGHVLDRGGALTRQDLSEYEAVVRSSLTVDIGAWTIATNPPPAVGGAVLAAMLLACADLPHKQWNSEALAQLINVQRASLDYRKQRLDLADDVGAEAAKLLATARSGQLLNAWTSASTVHTSAVDDNGIACAVTASSGYGSGEMPAGTGLWLNNCIGELELPSIARRKGRVLAAGTPGADRITTALHQFLVNILQMEMPLTDAIAHPRLHIDTSGDVERLMAEPGLDLPDLDLSVNVTSDLNMYFGGIGATLVDRKNGFQVASDPRREGGTRICVA
jgi:gamma-glutamyltranspeptidase/glutathione hydrolase